MAEKPLIAIVDDDESVREALRSLVRSLGYAVTEFASADQFLNCNCINETACLITDVQMPGLSGLELLRRLAMSGAKRIPAIVITAYPNETTERQARQAGVVGYLSKPFNERDLVDYLRAAVMFPSSGHLENT